MTLQSLFCWKFVCNLTDFRLPQIEKEVLQSLFCWKFVCNIIAVGLKLIG
ncbi:MAG: hypothetical protein PWQ69_1151 [Methanomicrobiaceae archaeon]|nr:hypothetical protein [Methanomicrobiaceae archaeon]